MRWCRGDTPTRSKRSQERCRAKNSGNVRRRKYFAYDIYFFYIPFIASWCTIFGVVAASEKHGLLIPIAIIVISSRFRALQEIGHFAIHGALSSNRKAQLIAADIFCHFPLFMPNAEVRQYKHVKIHHQYAGVAGRCHNTDELAEAGFADALPSTRFWFAVIRPITPIGVISNLRQALRNMTEPSLISKEGIARVASVMVVFITITYMAGLGSYLLMFLIPRFVVYPLFAWLSLLVEHRWFTDVSGMKGREKEYAFGRRTNYPGLAGKFTCVILFPYGDAFHLAHSLFPFVRWNHLPQVDRLLNEHDNEYSKAQTYGLLWRTGHRKGVLNYLVDRNRALLSIGALYNS